MERTGAKYTVQVGQETFEVKITVDTNDGKILAVQLHNPVKTMVRECDDVELLHCDGGKPDTTLREVSLTLVPST